MTVVKTYQNRQGVPATPISSSDHNDNGDELDTDLDNIITDLNVALLQDGSREADKLIISDGAGHLLQLPKLTTAERDALTPINGMMIYNSTTNEINKYENGSWSNLAGVTNLSALTIDANKDWAGKTITNLGAPTNDADAAQYGDVKFLRKTILDILIDLMKNNALDDVETIDYEKIIADFTSVAAGHKSTIDTVNSTSTFSAQKYGSPTGGIIDTLGDESASYVETSRRHCYGYTPVNGMWLQKIGVHFLNGGNGNFKVAVYDSDGASGVPGTKLGEMSVGLPTVAASWVDAELDALLFLVGGHKVYLAVHLENAADSMHWNNSGGGDRYYHTLSYATAWAGTFAGSTHDTNQMARLRTTAQASPAGIVITEELTTDAATHVQVQYNSPDGDILTCDITGDNKANWQNGINLREKVAIADLGTNLFIRFNLGLGETFDGYSILWWI